MTAAALPDTSAVAAPEPDPSRPGRPPRDRTLRPRIRAAVAAGVTRTPDLIEHLGDVPRQTVYSTVSAMTRLGQLERIGFATYAIPGPAGPTQTVRPQHKGRAPDTNSRARILALIDAGVTTPKTIADRLHRRPTSVQGLLRRMLNEGEVRRTGAGTYARPNGVGPPADDVGPPERAATSRSRTPSASRDLRKQLRANALIANALRELFPGGLGEVDPAELIDWVNLTLEMIT